MTENPFQPPQTHGHMPVIGVVSGEQKDLYIVAKYQRYVILCILAVSLSYMAMLVVPDQFKLVPGIAYILFTLLGLVSIVLLGIRVYGVALGILMGVLSMVPCLGLLVLVLVNVRATNTLKTNGIHVGFMGADLSKIAKE